MASGIINQIKEYIDNNQNFLLSGGAGSGKTYALGEVLEYIYEKSPLASVACMTYTNVAVDEIKERFPYKNLRVSTIHDFLWENIKDYQKNLKIALYNLILKEEEQPKSGIKYKGETPIMVDFFNDKVINYKEYKKIEEGIISHDEVLKLSNYMFEHYPLLSGIIKDKYSFILIDEYQDTENQVIQIFLDYLQSKTNKINVIGLFGDSMQSIYDKGIGDIQYYIDNGTVKEILKNDNYRCSKEVISLINKIRNDSIKQEPSLQDDQGNIINKNGSVKFIYSSSTNINRIKLSPLFENWDFNNNKETKELYLTHKLIANECGFIDLFDKYTNKDRLIGDNRDKLIRHLYKIKEILDLYKDKNYSELVRKINIYISKSSDKKKLKESFDSIEAIINNSIEDIIIKADGLNLIRIDDKLTEFMTEKEELYNAVKTISFRQVISLYEYEYDKTPYSTQHGIKGAEFENVFVVLDNGGWNNYNFKHLFENTEGKESIIKRTQKIFYVCSSRAKNNLVVYSENPSQKMINQAISWFGSDNVAEI
ncbi:MAG: AAA family ATPase [Candidatus Gastranaerophilales bacterium]|nr:AAA family ATPase [Candidatus Gastranaerophilales bacterium]